MFSILNVAIVTAALGALALLYSSRVRGAKLWEAAVTPLASIIGSGFLVVAPLLAFTVGYYAVFAITGLVGLAYLVGGAHRYNIRSVESVIEAKQAKSRVSITIRTLERISKLLLAFAFVIAIAFYLELLGAFALRGLDLQNEQAQKAIATALAGAISLFGLLRGLDFLVRLETHAVNALLAIVGALLVALLWRNAELALVGEWRLPDKQPVWDLSTLRQLLGAFLIVQGFETSRYLSEAFKAELRVRSMRLAQILVAVIYILFVGGATVMFDSFQEISETGIITLAGQISVVLGGLLIMGAIFSQLSSAVADIVGGGGLISEASDEKIEPHWTYPVVALIAVALIWSANIFEIISYASRAFALFYGVQCTIAAICACCSADKGNWRLLPPTGFALLALAMFAIAAFGTPAEGH